MQNADLPTLVLSIEFLFKCSHLQLPGCYYAANHVDLVVDFASRYVKTLLRLSPEDKSALHIASVVMAQYHRLPENVIYPLSTCCLSLSAVLLSAGLADLTTSCWRCAKSMTSCPFCSWFGLSVLRPLRPQCASFCFCSSSPVRYRGSIYSAAPLFLDVKTHHLKI